MTSLENPHTDEIEQALLGILLRSPKSLNLVVKVIDENDFLHPIHAEIYKKITDFVAEGKIPSPLTLKPFFQNREEIPEFYLSDLASSVISSVNLEDYAIQIRDNSSRRRFISMLEKSLESAYSTPDTNQLKLELSSALQDSFKVVIEAKNKVQIAKEIIDSFKLPRDCHDVGIPALTKAMAGGLYAGYTYGLAGAEKSGKTTTAQTISYNLNARKVRHAYIALEMGSLQIEQRNLARSMGINSLEFLKNDRTAHAQRIAETVSNTPDETLYLDMQGCTFNQIKSEIALLVANHKITGFILDYWQLIGGCDPRQNKSDFLFEIAQWCAGFCRRHGVWSILLSQLNRDGKLLGSAGLERACDQLYVLGNAKNQWGEGTFITLTHSRYTPTCTMGSEDTPRFRLNFKAGPHLEEIT